MRSELEQAQDSQRFDVWLHSWRCPLWFAVMLANLAVSVWLGYGPHWHEAAFYFGGTTTVALFDTFGSRHVRPNLGADR